MYGCQNWQCSAGDTPEPTAKKYKKTTYKKITNDGVQVENLDPTGLRKILLYMYRYAVYMYMYKHQTYITCSNTDMYIHVCMYRYCIQ